MPSVLGRSSGLLHSWHSAKLGSGVSGIMSSSPLMPARRCGLSSREYTDRCPGIVSADLKMDRWQWFEVPKQKMEIIVGQANVRAGSDLATRYWGRRSGLVEFFWYGIRAKDQGGWQIEENLLHQMQLTNTFAQIRIQKALSNAGKGPWHVGMEENCTQTETEDLGEDDWQWAGAWAKRGTKKEHRGRTSCWAESAETCEWRDRAGWQMQVMEWWMV